MLLNNSYFYKKTLWMNYLVVYHIYGISKRGEKIKRGQGGVGQRGYKINNGIYRWARTWCWLAKGQLISE